MINHSHVDTKGNVEAEGEHFEISLQDILMYTTATPSQPPLGFTLKPSLSFQDDIPFPRANTCSNTLHIPIQHTSLDTFVYQMCFGILHSPGLGQL